MSDMFRVFGTQLDPTVVQALQRHEKQRKSPRDEREREQVREARKMRKSSGRSQPQRRAAAG